MNDKQLVKETRALIAEVEHGDTAHAAWVAIQDRVRRLYEGRGQREVARLLGKDQKWVHVILAWDEEDPQQRTPWAGPRGEKREASTARKVLADPQTRRQALEGLERDELYDLADEAIKVQNEKNPDTASPRTREQRQAVREERSTDPNKAHRELVLMALRKASAEITRGLDTARDAIFKDDEIERLEVRLERHKALCDVLGAAIRGETDIDWDAELATLNPGDSE